ncbi:hypothetical protein ACFL39_01845 [Gemmatimonadota bacterium]
MIRQVLLLISLCLGMSGCGLFDPDYTDQILPKLIDVPIISYPIETSTNQNNPGFQTTYSRVNEIVNIRDGMLGDFIRPYIQKEIAGKELGDGRIRWKRIPKGDHEIILTVTRGDTLFYRLDFYGQEYGPTDHYWINGWVIPAIDKGYSTSYGGVSSSWSTTEGVHLITLDYPDWPAIGVTHVLTDTIDGGGALKWNNPDSLRRFLAQWDGFGHGSWTSQTEGSGNW